MRIILCTFGPQSSCLASAFAALTPVGGAGGVVPPGAFATDPVAATASVCDTCVAPLRAAFEVRRWSGSDEEAILATNNGAPCNLQAIVSPIKAHYVDFSIRDVGNYRQQ